MSTAESKPRPVLDELNSPFWEAARASYLSLQQCAGCRHVRYPISHVCPRCLSGDFTWSRMSGKGTVLSSIVFHQVYHAAFASEVPYNVSLVELDEGPRMLTNVIGVAPSLVTVGARVEAVFDPVAEDFYLPRFRIAGVEES